MSDWHGWKRGFTSGEGTSSPSLHIGPLPGRKSIALYEVDGGVIRAFAYFPNEEAARNCQRRLDSIMHVKQSQEATPND